jgi:hypothetical protein
MIAVSPGEVSALSAEAALPLNAKTAPPPTPSS